MSFCSPNFAAFGSDPILPFLPFSPVTMMRISFAVSPFTPGFGPSVVFSLVSNLPAMRISLGAVNSIFTCCPMSHALKV